MSQTGPRSYGQHCGLALALDVLGERWALLVVRELARGPKRFGDLQAGLDGIGTNLLSARLKRLEADGIVERVTLPAPAGVAAYDLTERGRALTPILEDLALWGAALLGTDADPTHPARRTRAVWAAMSMRAQLQRSDRPAPDGLYAFTVGGEQFWLRVDGVESDLRDGPPPVPADLTITTDLGTFVRLTGEHTAPAGVEAEGDLGRFGPLFAAFHMPPDAAIGAGA